MYIMLTATRPPIFSVDIAASKCIPKETRSLLFECFPYSYVCPEPVLVK